MNVTSNIMGIHSSAALKNCSISNPQCNSSYVCGLVNSSISQSGGTLLSCSFNCCYGDLCNGQGGGGILYLFFLNHFSQCHGIIAAYNEKKSKWKVWYNCLVFEPWPFHYRKIPKISPGAYIFQGPFWGAYFWGELCTEGNLRLKTD